MHVRKGEDFYTITMSLAGKKFTSSGETPNKAIIQLSKTMVQDLVYRYLDTPEVVFEWVNCHRKKLKGRLNKAVNEGFNVELVLYKYYPDVLRTIDYATDKWDTVLNAFDEGYRLHRISVTRSVGNESIRLSADDYTGVSICAQRPLLSVTLIEQGKFYFYTCWEPLYEAVPNLETALRKRLIWHFFDHMKEGQQC